jgi:hypothetical protein
MSKPKQWLLRLTDTQVISQDTYKDGILIAREIMGYVSSLEGVLMALETVTSGDGVFSIWDLRKRLKTLAHPTSKMQNAKYALLSVEEKELVTKAVKSIDWTFKNQIQVWVRWEEFFDDLRNIVEFDEENPPADYTADKERFDAEIEAIKVEQRRIEELAAAELEAETNVVLEVLFKELQDKGLLGPAATIEDVPEKTKKAAQEQAKANIELRKRSATAALVQSQDIKA